MSWAKPSPGALSQKCKLCCQELSQARAFLVLVASGGAENCSEAKLEPEHGSELGLGWFLPGTAEPACYPPKTRGNGALSVEDARLLGKGGRGLKVQPKLPPKLPNPQGWSFSSLLGALGVLLASTIFPDVKRGILKSRLFGFEALLAPCLLL